MMGKVQENWDFCWSCRIYYEDTDAGGVVFYANYLNYMERARTEWLRALGYEQRQLAEEQRLLFVVRDVRICYHRPACLDDVIDVCTRLQEKQRTNLLFKQVILRDKDQLLCDSEIRIVCLNAETWQPKALPNDIF